MQIQGESHGYGCGCGGCAGGTTSVSESPINSGTSSTPTLDAVSMTTSGSEISGVVPEGSAAGATTVGAVSNSTYSVSGTTLADAAAAIGAREWAGLTTWRSSFRASTDASGSVTSANVTVNLSKQMPVWANKRNRPEAERTEWDRFWNALNFHEDGHVGIVREDASTGRGFTNAHTLLEGNPGSDAAATMTTLSETVAAANDSYDSTTQHGIVQQTPFGTTVINTNPGAAAPTAPTTDEGA